MNADTSVESELREIVAMISAIEPGFAGRCCFEVTGTTWTLDFGARTVERGDLPGATCFVDLAPEDLTRWATRAFTGEAGFEFLRRVKAQGDPEVLKQLSGLFLASQGAGHGHLNADHYTVTAELLPDRRLVFMNNGYEDRETPTDFSWLRAEDHNDRFAINLVRRLVRGVDFTNAAVLDIGCGRGGSCSYVARYHGPREVVGLDFCQAAIDRCHETHQLPNVTFVQGDAQALPFDDAKFDIVMNIESSHCYPDQRRFFTEVRRVLKPGGTFCYTDNLPDPAAFYEKMLADVGFRVERYEDVQPNVLAALKANRETFEKFYRSMDDGDPARHALIEDIVTMIDYDRLDDTGGHYHMWKLVRT